MSWNTQIRRRRWQSQPTCSFLGSTSHGDLLQATRGMAVIAVGCLSGPLAAKLSKAGMAVSWDGHNRTTWHMPLHVRLCVLCLSAALRACWSSSIRCENYLTRGVVFSILEPCSATGIAAQGAPHIF